MSQILPNPLEASLRQFRAANPTKDKEELEEMQVFLTCDHFWLTFSPACFALSAQLPTTIRWSVAFTLLQQFSISA